MPGGVSLYIQPFGRPVISLVESRPKGWNYRAIISTEAEPRDNTNRSRAAQAAELKGGIIKLSFGRLAPPRFCFGNSIVMPDLIRHPVHLAPRFTQGHYEAQFTCPSIAEGKRQRRKVQNSYALS